MAGYAYCIVYGDPFHELIKTKVEDIVRQILGGDQTDLPFLKRLLGFYGECRFPKEAVDEIKEFVEKAIKDLKNDGIEDLNWTDGLVERIGKGGEKFHKVILSRMSQHDLPRIGTDEGKRLFWLSLDVLSDAHLQSAELKMEVREGLVVIRSLLQDHLTIIKGFLGEVILKIQASEA